MASVLVLGAGVIGLSCAWRAARAGWTVTVLDPAPATGASWVAGGMLAPVTEAWPGEESLLALGAASVQRWPGFAAELEADAGRSAGLRGDGTVVAATGSGDRTELDDLAEHLGRLGRPVQRLSGRELRRLEPSIGPEVRGGLSVPGDLAVDNRMLLAALRRAAERAGVRFDARAGAEVLGDGDRVLGVRCATAAQACRGAESGAESGVETGAGDGAGVRDGGPGRVVAADAVVVSAGAHSATLHPALRGLVRPVKGEILRLAHRPGALPPPQRTIRALVDGRHVYLVPRGGDDGSRPGVVLGATQYEAGFDTEVTVGGVRDLLRDAERVVPGISEYALLEASAGLRPASPDNLPLVGGLGPQGLIAATGHGRNGILLAPITAEAVVAALRGVSGPDEMRTAAPDRFAPAPTPPPARRTAPSSDGRGRTGRSSTPAGAGEVGRVRVDQR